MLVGLLTFSLAFGGPNVGKRPLLRQVTPRMLLPDVSELTNMPHVASAVSAFSAPSMLLSDTTPPAVAADVTGLYSPAGFSAPEVAVISTLATAFVIALGWWCRTCQQITDKFDTIDKKLNSLDTKLNSLDTKLNMITAPVAAIGAIVVAVTVVAAGVSLEKSAVTVFALGQVPVSRESAPLQVKAPSTSTTIAVASPFPARD